MPSWDILVPSVEHRTDKLTLLLAELERQCSAGHHAGWLDLRDIDVRVFRDNLEHEQSAKCQALLDSSEADYVSFIEDDDWVHERYVELIMGALAHRPDFVGFRLRFTESGVLQLPVVHSLQHERNEWIPGISEPDVLYRPVTHLNPMLRTAAMAGHFAGDFAMDRRFSDEVLESGLLKNEVFINEDVYHYRRDVADSIQEGPFRPVPPAHRMDRPDFPWVIWLQ